MILTKSFLETAEEKEELVFLDREEFDDFNLDLTIDDLFKLRNDISPLDTLEMSTEEFIEKCTIRQPMFSERVLKPSNMYYFFPKENISSLGNHKIKIYSKSTYARLGLRSSCQDQELMGGYEIKNFRPLVNLTTNNTSVKIKPGEKISHLVVDNLEFDHVSKPELEQMIESGELVIRVNGLAQKLDDIVFEGNNLSSGIVLHKDARIYTYNGDVLIPRNKREDDFKDLLIPKEGLMIKDNHFYLSSSIEQVEIPTDCVGFVKDMAYDSYTAPYSSHPNAPVIGPKSIFKGVITFENIHGSTGIIRSGEKQSVLYLRKLIEPIENGEKSKYFNQERADKSK